MNVRHRTDNKRRHRRFELTQKPTWTAHRSLRTGRTWLHRTTNVPVAVGQPTTFKFQPLSASVVPRLKRFSPTRATLTPHAANSISIRRYIRLLRYIIIILYVLYNRVFFVHLCSSRGWVGIRNRLDGWVYRIIYRYYLHYVSGFDDISWVEMRLLHICTLYLFYFVKVWIRDVRNTWVVRLYRLDTICVGTLNCYKDRDCAIRNDSIKEYDYRENKKKKKNKPYQKLQN